jgi:chorismate mutase
MKLDKNRKKIDRVDARILVLLQRRADIVREIGELKRDDGRPIVDRKRENEVIRRVADYNGGLLPEQAVTRIYRTILRESRQMQRDLADHADGVRP